MINTKVTSFVLFAINYLCVDERDPVVAYWCRLYVSVGDFEMIKNQRASVN